MVNAQLGAQNQLAHLIICDGGSNSKNHHPIIKVDLYKKPTQIPNQQSLQIKIPPTQKPKTQ